MLSQITIQTEPLKDLIKCCARKQFAFYNDTEYVVSLIKQNTADTVEL